MKLATIRGGHTLAASDGRRRPLDGLLQGKTFEAATPLGPWPVTADESAGAGREITCEVAGEQMQKADR